MGLALYPGSLKEQAGSISANLEQDNRNLLNILSNISRFVSDDALKLLFKTKPQDKILLVSDCLPCTEAKISEFDFAGEKIYYDGQKATSKEGTIAGSTTLLPLIIKRLHSIGMFNPLWINNPYNYHNIELDYMIEWDDNWNLV